LGLHATVILEAHRDHSPRRGRYRIAARYLPRISTQISGSRNSFEAIKQDYLVIIVTAIALKTTNGRLGRVRSVR
jgi:hypothetical protein